MKENYQDWGHFLGSLHSGSVIPVLLKRMWYLADQVYGIIQ